MRGYRIAAAAFAATLAISAPAWARLLSFHLHTQFGPVTLSIEDETGQVSGVYPDYNGKIYGEVTKGGNQIDGVWVQPTSERKCATQKNGSFYWGRLVFVQPREDRVDGRWGYCDDAPKQAWGGKLE